VVVHYTSILQVDRHQVFLGHIAAQSKQRHFLSRKVCTKEVVELVIDPKG
jgi:hypothetical protein